MSALWRNVPSKGCLSWQQPSGDCAVVGLELPDMSIPSIPVHGALLFEVWAGQSPSGQREAEIGATIRIKAPATQISLRHEMLYWPWLFIAYTSPIVAILIFAPTAKLCLTSQLAVTFVTITPQLLFLTQFRCAFGGLASTIR